MAGSYPFAALVDQRPMKRALALAAVSPEIRGVLLRGERGTAKSTAVRALADLLPERAVVADCPYGCPSGAPAGLCDSCRERVDAGENLPTETRPMRVVDLPLNASEDRVVGSIDLERAVQAGEREFEPGILAEANRNVLYVDEVNLLDDHIVDVLLDAAAMGENVVERDGVSHRHPAEFILVGTMNPEEGDLRPQLLDRFDLVVAVTASDDPDDRVEIARRREAFEADPEGFRERFADEQCDLRERIAAARDRLPAMTIDDEVLSSAAYEAVRRRAHGLRADVAVNRTARAIAALEGDEAVTEAHVTEAQYFAFPHRVEGVPEMNFGEGVLGEQGDDEAEGSDNETDRESDEDRDAAAAAGGIPIRGDEASYPVDRTAIQPPRDRTMREALARRTPSKVDVRSGRYVRARDSESVDDVAIDATLRAAAPHQPARRETDDSSSGIAIEPKDLRQKIRERRAEALVVFVVDASGSVMSGRQMFETKRGILSLVEDAYRARDRVAVVVFREEGAFTLVEPTRNLSAARRAVSKLTVGGNTPLAHGLVEAYELVERERRRDEDLYPLVVLFSDGQTNVEFREDGDAKRDAFEAAAMFADADVPSVFVDTGYQIDTTPDEIWTERKAERIKRKRVERNLDYAAAMDADYLPLVDLPRDTVLPDDVEVPSA
ncbi:ATPase associated with various cellular activities AAA_5 (plasmid) [Haloterrigena turkmenica DSM 5511]|uniref:ATPase associated with various cellular activities AAA_5 n=1 Tax=Haloterrigena turkmenica (strain ATCC 51198 / DSM 5511 / JCM 9101 / NCIMB 13204 / VKM B-1734 / 4k) TaxID=543526 RepID=D2S019_HALTV|nr:VWA domain-containing protein [Haloterrigena turkmenica]ADB62716.1 ATPase associated with various cellular activities AAA_5 [Haloterrigena turkmenica DSM 5511]